MKTETTPGTMTAEDIIALSKKHTLFEWSAQGTVDPLPVARAKGIYFWTPDGKRFIDFNSQLMCVNIGHGDERVVRAIQDQAARASLREPVHGDRAARAAGPQAGGAVPGRHRRVLLHQRRRRSQRERRQAGPVGDRPAQGPGALPVVSRRDGSRHHADRRSATLGRRTGDSRSRPRARPVSRHRARLGFGGAVAGDARGSHPARGAQYHRRLHPRTGDRNQRRARAAGRLPRRRPRAVHEVRHSDDLRRSDVGLRPDRRVVRRRSLECGAGHPDDGERADERVRAARRRRHAARNRRPVQGPGLLRRLDLQQSSAGVRRGAGDDSGLRGRSADRQRPDARDRDEGPARRSRTPASVGRRRALDRAVRDRRAGSRSAHAGAARAVQRHLG